jgi:formylglycine-generating enzyme required for sulfatase activity
MAFIPAGLFAMGATNDNMGDEMPVHDVFLGEFYMDKYEVTLALWEEVYLWATNHGYEFAETLTAKAANHPVGNIQWAEALKWCNARSEKDGLTHCYYTDAAQTNVYRKGYQATSNSYVAWRSGGYRLPTEAEWEKAARGGLVANRFPMGDTISHEQANYKSTSNQFYDVSPTRGYHPSYTNAPTPYTSPVGSFAPNGYGLYDMAGNVAELCGDCYLAYTNALTIDPRGPDAGPGGSRVFRGGDWSYDAVGSRLSSRSVGDGNPRVGFRCVR